MFYGKTACRLVIRLIAILMFSLPSGEAKAAVIYGVADLDTLPSATGGAVGTINKAGQIVGWAVPTNGGILDQRQQCGGRAGRRGLHQLGCACVE